MPIATPEVYAEMLSRAKAHAFAFPAINCTSSETINAAIKGFADAGSDGIIQFSTGGAEFASGLGIKEMVTGAVGLAEFAHVVADEVPDHGGAAHRPLPERQARHAMCARCSDLPGAGEQRTEPAVPVAHVGWLGRAARREPGDRHGVAGRRRRRNHPGDRDRRGRRRGGRRRGRDQREAVHQHEDFEKTIDALGARDGNTFWRRHSATSTACTSLAT